MKSRTLITILMTLGLLPGAYAADVNTVSLAKNKTVSVSDVNVARNGDNLTVDMLLDMSNLKVKSGRAILITPRLVGETDSIDLPSVGVYGRSRYYYYTRNNISMLTGNTETVYRSNKKPNEMAYNASTSYQDWMNDCTLKLIESEFGCCNKLLGSDLAAIGNYAGPVELQLPTLVFATPQVTKVKERSLSASANVCFRTDITTLDPKYMDNTRELNKIDETIAAVRNDKDLTIQNVFLKGYASPEGNLAHNKDLSTNRTYAVKRYIDNQFKFEPNVVKTEFGDEDWGGLREYVAQSNLANRDAILSIIDEDMADLDAKEYKIKSQYPSDYAYLLKYSYPYLRHTDYRINYSVRNYTDPEEIRAIMASDPSKLSVEEMYRLAKTYQQGSTEYNDVIKTAVALYPNDEAANLNAANVALSEGNYEAAARYLAKSGNSGESSYAKGVLAYMSGDNDTATTLLKQAATAGVNEANELLKKLSK
jgi:outer membrane protein OmpA-like peptidoglycan-associated protein